MKYLASTARRCHDYLLKRIFAKIKGSNHFQPIKCWWIIGVCPIMLGFFHIVPFILSFRRLRWNMAYVQKHHISHFNKRVKIDTTISNKLVKSVCLALSRDNKKIQLFCFVHIWNFYGIIQFGNAMLHREYSSNYDTFYSDFCKMTKTNMVFFRFNIFKCRVTFGVLFSNFNFVYIIANRFSYWNGCKVFFVIKFLNWMVLGQVELMVEFQFHKKVMCLHR